MSDETEEGLTKILVELENMQVGGESIWAKPLCDDLYELRNSPFYAFNLHFGDIVRATTDDPNLKPIVHEVVRRGGHNTLRVSFPDECSKDQQKDLLEEVKKWHACYERATATYLAIDVLPEGDYDAVFEWLSKLENEGILTFETVDQPDYDGFFPSEPETEDD